MQVLYTVFSTSQYTLFYYHIFGLYDTQHIVWLRPQSLEILFCRTQVLFLQVFFIVPDNGI